ncbi:hypothetical protein SH2C18_39050 [Clostridium sediminicola]|uniref:DUF5050 domain-containing protein n=1 Tax=Clostridium sediminicola TaxID=3114879 RepID=UPI0031F22C28
MELFNHNVQYLSITEDKSIYRIRLDGLNRSKVNSYGVDNFNVSEEWIYYTTNFDDNTYRIKIDGTGREKLD